MISKPVDLDETIKSISVLWFYADTPKRDTRHWKKQVEQQPQKEPTWLPFSRKDSKAIEVAYLAHKNNLKVESDNNNINTQTSSVENSVLVPVHEDYLSECNVSTLELYSVYWDGPVYEIRRGFWFWQPDGTTFIPCDHNLSQQLENGYWKYKPWKKSQKTVFSNTGTPPVGLTNTTNTAANTNIPTSFSSSSSPPRSSNSATNSPATSPQANSRAITMDTPELRWALFGPHMNKYVLYHSKSTAFLLSDVLSSKIARAVYSSLTKGENLGGIKLVRGWDQVEKLNSKPVATQSSKPVSTSDTDKAATTTTTNVEKEKVVLEDQQDGEPTIRSAKSNNEIPKSDSTTTTKDVKIENIIESIADQRAQSRLSSDSLPMSELANNDDDIDTPDREIQHLIFVVHGVGQKLGERMEMVNLVHDCNILRSTLKTSARQIHNFLPADSVAYQSLPVDGGVQILPIMWRQKVQVDKKHDDSGDDQDGDNNGDVDAVEKKNERDGGAPVGLEDLKNMPSSSTPPTTSSTFDGVGETPSRSTETVASEQEPDRKASLQDITLDGVPSIRMLVSDVALDLLLYMTPRYRQEIVSHVTSEMNRLYKLFMKRNPDFRGKVSLYAHSLGSLIAFDILCNQPNTFSASSTPSSAETPAIPHIDLGDIFNGSGENSKAGKPLKGNIDDSDIVYRKLDFEVENLFGIGSPLGLFLLLRGDELRARLEDSPVPDIGYVRPRVKSLYNIFHPFDPVSYRIEPMFSSKLTKQKPPLISYTKGGLTGKLVSVQDFSAEIMGKGWAALVSAKLGIEKTTAGIVSGAARIVETVQSSVTPSKSKKLNEGGEDENTLGGTNSKDNTEGQLESDSPKPQKRDDDIFNLNTRGRLDFALQEGVLENAYLTALGVHMNYWGDQDVAVFLLRELYKDLLSGSASNTSEEKL